MTCHGCASNFSLFSKEQSCPNCNFLFCSKCLKERISIKDKSEKVCSTCFKHLSHRPSVSAYEFEPPALLLKRLEALDNPEKPPIMVYKGNPKRAKFEAYLDPEDREIYERLQKLKECSEMKAPTDEEIRRRLLILKGIDENIGESSQVLHQPSKSEQGQVDSLLSQYMYETDMKQKAKERENVNMEDIGRRLKKLQATENMTSKSTSSKSYESDCDSNTKRILEKILAEARLQEKWEDSYSKSESDESFSIDSDEDDSESPECIICSEKAAVKCLGCDRSLYCQSCYDMGHDSSIMENHRAIKIVEKISN